MDDVELGIEVFAIDRVLARCMQMELHGLEELAPTIVQIENELAVIYLCLHVWKLNLTLARFKVDVLVPIEFHAFTDFDATVLALQIDGALFSPRRAQLCSLDALAPVNALHMIGVRHLLNMPVQLSLKELSQVNVYIILFIFLKQQLNVLSYCQNCCNSCNCKLKSYFHFLNY